MAGDVLIGYNPLLSFRYILLKVVSYSGILNDVWILSKPWSLLQRTVNDLYNLFSQIVGISIIKSM